MKRSKALKSIGLGATVAGMAGLNPSVPAAAAEADPKSAQSLTTLSPAERENLLDQIYSKMVAEEKLHKPGAAIHLYGSADPESKLWNILNYKCGGKNTM